MNLWDRKKSKYKKRCHTNYNANRIIQSIIVGIPESHRCAACPSVLWPSMFIQRLRWLTQQSALISMPCLNITYTVLDNRLKKHTNIQHLIKVACFSLQMCKLCRGLSGGSMPPAPRSDDTALTARCRWPLQLTPHRDHECARAQLAPNNPDITHNLTPR